MLLSVWQKLLKLLKFAGIQSNSVDLSFGNFADVYNFWCMI